jgi:ATP-binding cassette subfamily B protein
MGTSRKTLAIFWRESMRYPVRWIGALVLWPLGIAIQDMAMPFIAAQAINKLTEVYTNGTTNYWDIFAPYLWAFIITGLVGQLVVYSSLQLFLRLQTLVRKNIEQRVYNWLLAQSMQFHANSFSGALVNQANRFATAYVQLVDVLVLNGLNTLTKFIVAIVVIAFFSPLIAAAMFTWTVLFVYVNVTLMRQRLPLSKTAAKADTAQTAHLADTMGNIGAIKAYAGETREQTAYKARSDDRGYKKLLSWSRAVKNGSVTALMMLGIQFIVLVLSIYAVMQGHIQIGTLLLIYVYLTQLIGSLWNLGNLTRGIEQSVSDAAEMTEILHTEPEIKDTADQTDLQVRKGSIQFNQIVFSHADAKKDDALFADFDLTIASGEKVGLVGHSGSGKTTLTRLLLRFADVDGGAITIDGQDIRSVRQADLRAQIAYVPQEPLLFHRSLRENIAYGKTDATDEQVCNAARKAHAAEFIEKLPNQYDTLVGERGIKLSGGQRQRIAIARAILKDARILVLDEATSALDSESEKLIQSALWELMKDRTAIVIAHRLSTVQRLDRIVVLDNGKIIEQGSHKDLLTQKGEYAKLWTHQSGGFIEE